MPWLSLTHPYRTPFKAAVASKNTTTRYTNLATL